MDRTGMEAPDRDEDEATASNVELLLWRLEDFAAKHRGGKQSVNRIAGQLRAAIDADRRQSNRRALPVGERIEGWAINGPGPFGS